MVGCQVDEQLLKGAVEMNGVPGVDPGLLSTIYKIKTSVFLITGTFK